jgi:hypothetical protein
MPKQVEMNTRVVKAFIWSGPALIAAMIVAQWGLMRFIPPPSPALSAQQITRMFIERATEIRIGAVIQCIFWSFWATWGVAITVFIRRMERSFPILTYGSLALVGGGSVFFIFIPMTWAVCAFRAGSLDPHVIQILNDWVWFDWLFTWPPFALWMIVIAIAIFNDHNVPTCYPRWLAYFNWWCAILIFPAGLIAFFKTGPFAYNGIGAFWFPFAVFFSWMVIMTYKTYQLTNREHKRLTLAAEQSKPSVIAQP